MPTYEYACTACGHRLDAVQKFSDDPLTVCPECSGALRKVYGAVGIVLKGSGFYKNDSRSGSAATSTKKESDSKDSTSSDTKSDSSTKTESSSSSTSDNSSASSSSPAKDAKAPAASTSST